MGLVHDEILTREVGAVEKGYKLTATVVEKLKIDGYPAIKLIEESTSNAGTEYSYEVAVYIKGPFNVRISATSLRFLDKPLRPNGKFLETYVPIFNHMLSTFKFM